MTQFEMNDFNRKVFEAVKDYHGMKLSYDKVCQKLSITESALVKSLLHLIDTKALFYPGGPHSRVFFTGARPTNWKTVVHRAILDALVEFLHRFEGRPLKANYIRGFLGPGPSNFRLRDQLNELQTLGEITQPVPGTYFVGEPPEDWLKKLLSKDSKKNGVIYHRHSKDSDAHLRAKLHSQDDLRKEANAKGIDFDVLTKMHFEK